MKSTIALRLVPVFGVVLFAQGPGGGFGGPRGFEGPAGFAGRGAGILGAGPGSRTPVTGAPYSATETLQRQQTLANGNQIATKEQSNVYRDSQGRIRTEETITPSASSGKAAYSVVTIFDPSREHAKCTRFVDDDRAPVDFADGAPRFDCINGATSAPRAAE
jgi:hypothetical protein